LNTLIRWRTWVQLLIQLNQLASTGPNWI